MQRSGRHLLQLGLTVRRNKRLEFRGNLKPLLVQNFAVKLLYKKIVRYNKGKKLETPGEGHPILFDTKKNNILQMPLCCFEMEADL